jgi:hypothetical protein
MTSSLFRGRRVPPEPPRAALRGRANWRSSGARDRRGAHSGSMCAACRRLEPLRSSRQDQQIYTIKPHARRGTLPPTSVKTGSRLWSI